MPNGTDKPAFNLQDALKKFQGSGASAKSATLTKPAKIETPKLEPPPAVEKQAAPAKPVFSLTDAIKKFQPERAASQQRYIQVGRRIDPYIPFPELGEPPTPPPKHPYLTAISKWLPLVTRMQYGDIEGAKKLVHYDEFQKWKDEKIEAASKFYNWNKIDLFTRAALSENPYHVIAEHPELLTDKTEPITHLGKFELKTFKYAAAFATDPVNVGLMLAGGPLFKGLDAISPFIRAGVDSVFAAYMTYGAGQGLANAYVNFENGDTGEGFADLLDAGMQAGFATGGFHGAIRQTRTALTLNTMDRLAMDTYKRSWKDLPAKERNEIAGRVAEASAKRADLIKVLQEAENNRDVEALRRAYGKISGQKIKRMKGVKPAPEERIAAAIPRMKDAEFEGFLWDASMAQNKRLWGTYWKAKKSGEIPGAGDIVNENLRTKAQQAELFEELARGEQALQRTIYEEAKRTDEQASALRRELDAREARLHEKLKSERARFPRISPGEPPVEKRPFQEPATELGAPGEVPPPPDLLAGPTGPPEGQLPAYPQQVGEQRLALENLLEHVDSLLESVRRPQTTAEIEEAAEEQAGVFRGRRAAEAEPLLIEPTPRPLPTVKARIERQSAAREELRGVAPEPKYRLENLRQQIQLIEGGHRRPTDTEELERLKKAYDEEEYQITARQAEEEEARLNRERGYTYKGRREYEEPGIVLDLTPAQKEKEQTLTRLHQEHLLAETQRMVQEHVDELQERAREATPKEAKKIQEAVDKAKKAVYEIDQQREEILEQIPEEDRPDVDRDRPAATIPQQFLGAVSQIKTARGYTVPVQYAVLDARAIQASHDTELKVNPMYPARIQPRDRTRVASAAQRDEIAGNLDPNQLGENFSGNNGAPVIGDDLFVEGGNMRAIALKRLYEINAPQAAEYKKWLAENADKFGINPDTLKMLDKPMLVRVRRGTLADRNIDRPQFARDLNEPFEAQMSTVEQAKTDAAMLTDDLMGLLHPSETGNIMTAANQPFITEFFNRVVSPAARGRYMLADGQLSQEGVNRIQNAVFAKAFPGAEPILEKLLADPDTNIRNAARAMFQAAPKFAQLQDLVNQGVLQDLNISTEIAEAARKLSGLRETGQPVGDYLKTGQMFGPDISETARELLTIFHENARRPANVGDILSVYADEAMRVGRKDQTTMFGAPGEARKEDILRGVKKIVTGEGGLFVEPPSVALAEPVTKLEAPPEKAPEEVVPEELPEKPKKAKKLPAKFGEKNVVFKKARHEQNASDIQKMISDLAKGQTPGMAAGAPPIDPRLVLKLAEEIGYYVEGGIRSLADITTDLIDRFSEGIRPYITPAWEKFNQAKGGEDDFAKADQQIQKEAKQLGLFAEVPSAKLEPRPEAAERGVAANAPVELKEPIRTEPRPVGAAERAKPAGDGESGRRAAGGVAGRPGRRSEERDRAIRDVPAANLQPEVERKVPPAWKPEEWTSGLKEANLPQNARIPTRRLYRHISDKLIFTGQDLVADYALSELMDGSGGVVIATTTGTGKTYLASALIRQIQEVSPESMKNVLILTKNKNLIKDFQEKASNFGVSIEDFPVGRGTPQKDGIYAATYATAIGREGIDQFPWDLVIADESGEARNWWVSKQGALVKNIGDKAAKMIYMSATPFHNAVEVGYLSKLNLWKKGTFEDWVGQFGVHKDVSSGEWRGHSNPRKVEKLRQQLMERGQFINWDRNMEGFHSSFAVTPVSPVNMQKIHDTVRGYRMVEEYYSRKGSGKMVMATRGNAVGFLKHLIETFRVPEAIELAKKARQQGWQVIIFSERRSPVDELYNFMQQADMAYNGEVSRLVPKVPGISAMLRDAIGEDLAIYTGEKSTGERRTELKDFIDGKKGVLYSTYGAGGIGVSMHDEVGTRPRVAIYLGPPWSGVTFDQAIGRPWRFGTKSNVHAIFLFSNTQPEVNLVAGKILPRMQSLRAIISGVGKSDPIVSRLQDIDKVLAYSHGEEQKNPSDMFTNTVNLTGFTSHKEVSIPDASTAMYQGIQIKIRNTANLEAPPKERTEEGGATLYSGLPFLDPKIFKKYILDDMAKLFSSKVEGSVSDADRAAGVVDRIAREIFDSPTFVKNSADKLGTSENEAKFVSSVGHLAADAATRTSGDPAPVIRATLEEATGWLQHFAGVRDVSEIGGRAGKAASTIYDWYLGSSGRGLIKKIASKTGQPTIGAEIVSDIMEYQTVQGNTAGPWELKAQDILKKYSIKDKDFSHLWDVVEDEAEPRHPDFGKAAEEIRALNREIQQVMVREGVTVSIYDRATGQPTFFPFPRDLRPTYMPRIYDEEVFQHGTKKREQIIGMLMKKHGISQIEAEIMLDRKNNRETPLVGNIERAREFDVEGYEKTGHAYMKYLEGAAEVVARTKVFGQYRGKLREKVGRIDSVGGRHDINEILDTLLSRNYFMTGGPRELVRFASDWTSVMKMPFTAIKMLQHLPKAAVMTNTRSFARALEKVIRDYPQAYREAVESGAALHQMRVDMLRDYGVSQSVGGRMLRLYQVPEADTLGRVLSDQTARMYLNHYALPELIQNPQSVYRRLLTEHFGLTDVEIDRAIQNKAWEKSDLNKAANRVAAKSQGTWDPTELPVGWRAIPKDKAGQILAAMFRTTVMLKGYIYKNGVFFRDMLWNEAKKGNFRPFVPFLLIFPVLSEMIEDLAQAAKGNPKRFEELMESKTYEPANLLRRITEDVAFMGATNLATGFMDTVSQFRGNETTAIFRTAAGPLGSDLATFIADVVRSFNDVVEGRPDKLLKLWNSFGRSVSPLYRTGQALEKYGESKFGDYSLEPVPIEPVTSNQEGGKNFDLEPVPIQ